MRKISIATSCGLRIIDDMNIKPMLSERFTGQPVRGWLMSEKLDGVRAIWTGSKLMSRNGNEFFAPQWFIRDLPAGVPLDGELYIGRGKFQATLSAVRKKTPKLSDWADVTYMVFDAPTQKGSFAERLAFASAAISDSIAAKPVKHVRVAGKHDAEERFAKIVSEGGEGIMLRDPSARYHQFRSDAMLKVKLVESDEATVIGHSVGAGRFQGMTGALNVQWNGIKFSVGSGMTDADRATPPAIGDRVTFAYSGITDSGKPRLPVFIAARNYE